VDAYLTAPLGRRGFRRQQLVCAAAEPAILQGFARPFADGALVLVHHLRDVLLACHPFQHMLDELLVFRGLRQLTMNIRDPADLVGGEVPEHVGQGIAGVAGGFGEVADEFRAGVAFQAGVAQFDDPGAGVFALGVAAHEAIPPGVVDDDDGDLAPAELEQPVGEGLVVHAFVFIHAGGQGAEIVQDDDLVALLDDEVGDALAVFDFADVEAGAVLIEEVLVVEVAHLGEVQPPGAVLGVLQRHLAIDVEHGDVIRRRCRRGFGGIVRRGGGGVGISGSGISGSPQAQGAAAGNGAGQGHGHPRLAHAARGVDVAQVSLAQPLVQQRGPWRDDEGRELLCREDKLRQRWPWRRLSGDRLRRGAACIGLRCRGGDARALRVGGALCGKRAACAQALALGDFFGGGYERCDGGHGRVCLCYVMVLTGNVCDGLEAGIEHDSKRRMHLKVGFGEEGAAQRDGGGFIQTGGAVVEVLDGCAICAEQAGEFIDVHHAAHAIELRGPQAGAFDTAAVGIGMGVDAHAAAAHELQRRGVDPCARAAPQHGHGQHIPAFQLIRKVQRRQVVWPALHQQQRAELGQAAQHRRAQRPVLAGAAQRVRLPPAQRAARREGHAIQPPRLHAALLGIDNQPAAVTLHDGKGERAQRQRQGNSLRRDAARLRHQPPVRLRAILQRHAQALRLRLLLRWQQRGDLLLEGRAAWGAALRAAALHRHGHPGQLQKHLQRLRRADLPRQGDEVDHVPVLAGAVVLPAPTVLGDGKGGILVLAEGRAAGL